ncbi:MAG: alpha/beta hydrolase-fold protein [Microbacterium sp.]
MPDLELDDAAVRWGGEPDGQRVIVLLHGYGSDENDLFSLARLLPTDYCYVAVRAPLDLPWPQPGASWYPIEGLTSRSAEGVNRGTAALLDWVDRALPTATSIGLVGFSQGGAIALQALRTRPDAFAFVANLSGYSTPGDLPGDEALAETKPPVFWGRGELDEVIPSALVEHTTQWLPSHANLVGRVYPFIGHSVSQEEFDDLGVFLAKQLG